MGMQDKEEAILFLNSMRGQYIVSQALHLAIKSIMARPKIHQEPSNVRDMQYLLDELFPIYKAIGNDNF